MSMRGFRHGCLSAVLAAVALIVVAPTAEADVDPGAMMACAQSALSTKELKDFTAKGMDPSKLSPKAKAKMAPCMSSKTGSKISTKTTAKASTKTSAKASTKTSTKVGAATGSNTGVAYMAGGGGMFFNPATDPLPTVATRNFTDPARIERISKFRGGYGHDYSYRTDESCRSMKHYLWAYGGDPGAAHNPPWTTIPYYAPADGTITWLQSDGGEAKFSLQSTAQPAFSFFFYHVTPASGLRQGSKVSAGQPLGTVATDDAHVEIAVQAATSGGRWTLVSFFQVASPAVLAEWAARGLASVKSVIISKAERDAKPLTCDPDTVDGRFLGGDGGFTDSTGLATFFTLK